jgi:hypothetical protein
VALLLAAPVALAIILAPATEAATLEHTTAGGIPASGLASGQRFDPEADRSVAIPGCREIDLAGMDPGLQQEFVRVIAAVATEYELDVPYILPTPRWNGVTGAPSSGALMFASDLGIGFDPTVWSARRSPHVLESFAGLSHTAANGKNFAGLIAHEMGHVLLAQRFGIDLLKEDNPARRLVERYRLAGGVEAITGELGNYAWRGSAGRPKDAWQETFGEAFAAYYMDPRSVSGATLNMVERVLRL